MNRLLAAALLGVLALSGRSMPQGLVDVHRKIRQSVDERDYKTAIIELQDLQVTNPKEFTTSNFDYLLARLAERDGQLAVAMSNYQAVVNRASVLKVYALKHLSAIAASTGNLLLERIYLYQIMMVPPGSLLRGGANFRLAHNTFETGNTRETIRILDGDISAYHGAGRGSQKTGGQRESRAMLAEACLRSGEAGRARQIFNDLINNVPNPLYPDDVALSAARGLDLLDGGTAELAVSEHLRRANIYQFNRDFAAAKLHYESVIAESPVGADVSDAAFQIGRGLVWQSEFVEAIKWFERILEQYPDSKTASDALLHAASAYAHVGKSREAITRYHNFIDKYPADEKIDRAYMNIIDILRDQGSDTDALKWCAKTRDAFNGKLPATLASFAEARIYIAGGDWQNALAALERLAGNADLGGTSVPGGTNRAEVSFLRAFVLEQMKRFAEAIDEYLAVPDGREEYYGWRATERLKLLSAGEASAQFISQKMGSLSTGLNAKDADVRQKNAMALLRLTDLPDLRQKALNVLKAVLRAPPKYLEVRLPAQAPVAEQLLYFGLYDEAAFEIGAAMPSAAKASDDTAYTLALYYKWGDRADLGIGFIEPIWKKMPSDYPLELMPRDQLELLYPAPYADELLRAATVRGVDPRLVLAMMRQESRFRPDAKSYAAARGLMQFIPSTSKRIAGELGRDSFREADLFYPPNAILFGSQYLADLFRIFPDQPDAVAGGYNAGDESMKRWLTRSRSSLAERYVPEIVYAQSKDYVYKVMTNYRIYRYLYDEQLRSR